MLWIDLPFNHPWNLVIDTGGTSLVIDIRLIPP